MDPNTGSGNNSSSQSDAHPIRTSQENSIPSCPVTHRSSADGSEGCPVKHEDRQSMVDSYKEMASYNAGANDLVFGQDRHPSQKRPLSTFRKQSTIPNADFVPEHQPKDTKVWVYPSEQQYYNAMKRKGYDPSENDVPVVLAIHNTVNEQGWKMLKDWENLKGCGTPKLKRFMGRPKDLSPKAFLKGLFGYSKPFDRHDWIVESNGEDVRYVIDFYKGSTTQAILDASAKGQSQLPVIAMHMDVRPAVDSPSAALLRLKVFFFSLIGINPFLSNNTNISTRAAASTISSNNSGNHSNQKSGASDH